MELVLTTVLLGIVVAVSGILLGRGVDSYRLITLRTDEVRQAQTAMLRMEKELETLRSVSQALPNRVEFSDPDLNSVDFRLIDTTLFRGPDLLAEDVTQLAFTYYRDNGEETSAAPQVRRIHMEMTVEESAGISFNLRTDVFPKIFIYENFL